MNNQYVTQYKKVKQTDKRKMHTLLKLIGRTGSGRFVLFFFIVYMFQLFQLPAPEV